MSLARLATLPAALDADNREDREAVRWGWIPAGMVCTGGVRGDSAGIGSAEGSFFSRGAGVSGREAGWGEAKEAGSEAGAG